MLTIITRNTGDYKVKDIIIQISEEYVKMKQKLFDYDTKL